MYQPPIKIYETAMETIIEQRENAIFAKVQDAFDVHVDKDELIRALQYDRGQYEKGYADGKAEAVQQWIPVTERLPKTIPCGAGTEYSEAVNVLTSGRKVLTAIWDGTDFISDAEFWEAEDEEITHWTPVLLPLPEPQKEG